MISICTVTLNRLQDFLNIFCTSVVESTREVSEVIIINAESEESSEWTENFIHFRVIGGKHNVFRIGDPTSYCAQHAFGLHQAVELAKNDYVLISDPDIFFYTKIDEFYLNLADKYNLHFVGISRPDAVAQSIVYFPCIMNLFTKKEYLPTKDFLSDFDLGLSWQTENVTLPGKYFYPGCPVGCKSFFPNPDGHYETGCNLLLWTKEKNYNWLSFQTPDCHTYYTKYYRANFKPKLPNTKILYHASLAAGPHNRIVPFTEAWNSHKNSIDENY